jgi:hypothetical protein
MSALVLLHAASQLHAHPEEWVVGVVLAVPLFLLGLRLLRRRD